MYSSKFQRTVKSNIFRVSVRDMNATQDFMSQQSLVNWIRNHPGTLIESITKIERKDIITDVTYKYVKI